MAYCSSCGAEIDNDAKFCHVCGERTSFGISLESSSEKESKQKRWHGIHLNFWIIVGMTIGILFIIVVIRNAIMQKNMANLYRVKDNNIEDLVYIDYSNSGNGTNTFVYDEISIEIPEKWGEPTYNAPFCYFYPNESSWNGMVMIYSEKNSFGKSLDEDTFLEIEKGMAKESSDYTRIKRSKYKGDGKIINQFYVLDFRASLEGDLYKHRMMLFEYNDYIYFITLYMGNSHNSNFFDIYTDIMDSVTPAN